MFICALTDQIKIESDYLPNQHVKLTLCLMKYEISEEFAFAGLSCFQLNQNTALHIVKMFHQSSVKR